MQFNSFEFLLFLPLVFLLYWFVFRTRRTQNLFLIVASYIFYGWWNWRFLLLIVFTSLCSFVSGLLLEKYKERREIQTAICTSNIVINLAVLGIFKYFNFFVESLDSLVSGIFGYELGWVSLNIILPVGISFYTFQALSYSIDVYKYRIKATHAPVEFFAYIGFFPQLVAGPIERATSLLPQFQKARQFDYVEAVDGLKQMLWGFFKKIVVADNCAIAVNLIWGDYANQSGIILVVGAVLFTFQIYCDFSGYSDIAIGCAKLFGFELLRNFNVPYFSRSIPEFWRRWHISLMSWFRDYVFISLGGSRCRKRKTICNIFIVWAISGLWHGANWTFVCWGVFHAVIISVYFLLGIDKNHKIVLAQGRYFPSVKEFFQMTLTFGLAAFGWILFRSETIGDACIYLTNIFQQPWTGSLRITDVCPLVTIPATVFLVIIEWLQRERQHALDFCPNGLFSRYHIIRYGFYLALVFSILSLSPDKQAEFIYFQF